MRTARVLVGDVREVLRTLPADSVQCVVTSPPYWGLRDYGHEGQIGLERTPEEYVANMVAVFREVRRVLRPDGVLWLNLGDCYAGGGRGGNPTEETSGLQGGQASQRASMVARERALPGGLKPKDLVGIPWLVAFALRADGWWLRSDVIWSKPNPMPESITDRPTKAHEYLFLLTKSERYFYDKDAILEPAVREASGNAERKVATNGERSRLNTHLGSSIPWTNDGTGRNRRTVWTIATQPYSGAHFAVMPEALVEPCILAGTSEKGACEKCGAPWERDVESNNPSLHAADHDNALGFPADGKTSNPQSSASLHRQKGGVYSTRISKGWSTSCGCGEEQTRPCVVLDPFGGSGTVPTVALRLGREAVMVDLNPTYAQLAQERIVGDAPLLNRAKVGT